MSRATIGAVDSGPAPPPSSAAAARTMRANRRRDTAPELAVRRALHARGLRFLVDVPVPGTSRRRRADVLLRGARIALFVDGCFWHSCPRHQHLPRANREWWTRKMASIVRRDRDTDRQVRAAGWMPVRVWEHEPAALVAGRVRALVLLRVRPGGDRGRNPSC